MKLAGIRVVDLTRFLPGPYISRIMADHGADVLKVESPQGDPTRRIGTIVDQHTTYFRETNRNKKSIVLDLKLSRAQQLLLELATRADVVLESFRPGVADRLGISYAKLKKSNPGIVYCSISAFGQTGPRFEDPVRDLGVQALSGFLALSCDKDGIPMMPGAPAADIAAGLTALSGILMALVRRQQSKEGDFVDASMFDSLLAWTPHFADRVFLHGAAPDPSMERWWGGAAFYNIYRTADDRYVTLSGTAPRFASATLKALGRSDLVQLVAATDESAQSRLKEALAEAFLTRTQQEWVALFDALDVPFAPVLDLNEAYHDPQTKARKTIVKDGEIGTFSSPLRFSAEPGRTTGNAPAFGEHTDDILAGLGYDEAARSRFYALGVCGAFRPRDNAR